MNFKARPISEGLKRQELYQGHAHAPQIWNGTADIDRGNFHSRFIPQAVDSNQGELGLRVFSSRKEIDFDLQYTLSGNSLDRIREIEQAQRESEHLNIGRGGKSKDSKLLEQNSKLNEFLDLQRVFSITEILQQKGVLQKGNAKQESVTLNLLAQDLETRWAYLNRFVGAKEGGAEFIRELLVSGDEQAVRLGLNLAVNSDHLIGAVARELEAVHCNLSLVEGVRELAYGLLPVRRRRKVPRRVDHKVDRKWRLR